ncbi:MAG: hypothetical protein ABIZ05_13220 [Pseudonocardiaceae bacterium]
MSEVLSFAEVDGQHVELLPARTVMSLFSAGCSSCGGEHNQGGNGGSARGGLGVVLSVIPITLFGDQINSAGNATGGAGGNAG